MMTKSTTGWMVLAFSLVVPGVLFYQWYAHLDKVHKHELNVKVRGRIPEGGPFAISPNKDKPVNPLVEEVAASSTSADAQEIEESPVETAQETHPLALPVPQTTAPLPMPATPETTETASVPKIHASSVPALDFLSWRDPTMSPHDKVLLERWEVERQRQRTELKNPAPRKRPKSVDILKVIANTIELQGIISKPGGGKNQAIVNGEAYGEGDMVGKVKVVRITQQEVVFTYKDKRFVKSLNR